MDLSSAAEAQCSLGVALRHAGDLERAAAHFERAIALNPRNARAYLLLTDVRKGPLEQPRLRQMEALIRDAGSLSTGQRIELRFALAKAYDDRDDYARSFDHLREGNALKRSISDYDEAETLRVFETLPKMFAKPLVAAMAGGGNPSATPVFIFGMPRSGTTLVEQILAAHPEVHAAGELGAFENAMRGFAEIGADPNDIPAFMSALAEQLRTLGTRYVDAVTPLAPEAKRITDKWPWSFKFAGIIHLALPNARMIHVLRDPLDTCFSCFATLFTDDLPYMYEQRELGRYYRGYRKLMGYWSDAMGPGAVLEIRYEDLIADFGGQARRLLEHCGLEWDDACTDFWAVKRPIRTASATAVRQPLYSTAVGRAGPYRDSLVPLRAELGV